MRIKTLEDLKAVQEKGVKLTYPDKIKIMVGFATCGISAGADKVYKALEKKVAEVNLDAVLEITGCIGFCQREPLVDVIFPGKVRLSYQAMTPEKAEALVEAIKAGEIYPENLLCRIDEEEILVQGTKKVYANPHPVALPVEVPNYNEVPFFKKQVKIALRNCGYIHPERIEEYIGRGGYLALHKVLTSMTPLDVINTVK
ncbi:MAG: NADH-quinone oxidoreductase subunit F, partial [Desulfobacca sp.]